MQEILIHNDKDGASFAQAEGDTVLRAALRAGVGLAHECNSGGCGACKFELVEGELDTLWPDAPGLSERDRRRGRHLACQCRALGPVRIKAQGGPEYVPRIRPARQTARLAGITDLTHDIREFRFVTDGPAAFLPGQYAMLDLPGVGTSRAYSLSNTAGDGRETLAGFLIGAREVATGTEKIAGGMLVHGKVVEANLPIAVDAAGKADVAARIRFI